MSRFTRFSRISPQELCRMSERRAWCCGIPLFGLFLALAAGALFCPAPARDGLGGEDALFTAMRFSAAEEEPRCASEERPSLTPLPLAPPVAVQLAVSPVEEVQVMLPDLLVECDFGAVEDASWRQEVELPEQLTPSTTSGPRKVAVEGGAARQGEWKPASYRSTPRPPYPPSMLRRRVQGRVELRVVVDAEGVPQEVELLSSSGYAAFDHCARQWVLAHWRFHPARQDGVAVASVVRTQLEFVFR